MGQVAKRRQWAAAQEEGKGGPVDREGQRKKHSEKGSIPSGLNLPQAKASESLFPIYHAC